MRAGAYVCTADEIENHQDVERHDVHHAQQGAAADEEEYAPQEIAP